MIKSTLLTLFILASFAVQAQNVSVDVSEPFKYKPKGSGVAIVPEKIGDYFYTVQTDYKNMQLAFTAKLLKIKYSVSIHKFDGNMQEVGSYTINNGEDYGPFLGRVQVFNNCILVLYYKIQEDQSINLILTIIEPETLTVKSTRVLYTLASKYFENIKVEQALGKNYLRIKPSADSSRVLICQSGNTNEIFTCTVNKNFDTANATVTSTGQYTNFMLSKALIDNSGNAWLTYYHYEPNKPGVRGMLAVTAKGEKKFLDCNDTSSIYKVDLQDLYIDKSQTTLYLYGNYEKEQFNEGLFVTSFNISNCIYGTTYFYPIPDYIMQRLKKTGAAQKDKSVVSVPYAVDYTCTVLEDGTLAFSGTTLVPYFREVVSITSHSAFGGPVTESSLLGGPILVFFVNKTNCKVHAVYRKIPGSNALNVLPAAHKNTLLLIYNDAPKNITLKDTSRIIDISYPGNLVLAQATLTAQDGIIDKKQLNDKIDGENFFYITNAQPLGNGVYRIPFGRNRADLVKYYNEISRWGTVTIKW